VEFTFRVELDEERQFIRQQVVGGSLTAEQFARVDAATQQCAARLRDPNDVRILASTRESGRPTAGARRAMLSAARRPSLTRLAVCEASPLGPVLIRFVAVLAGAHKIRGFANERDALHWLLG